MLKQTATDNLIKLIANPYPGRVIVIGAMPGDYEIQLYAIMGRSENSRNRKFVHDGDIVRTEAVDLSKITDPSLIIYNAMRSWRGKNFVTNGAQTDTIYHALVNQFTNPFEHAMRHHEFEPDLPNYTPRISAISDSDGVRLSILSRSPHGKCERAFFHYFDIPEGFGYCIHTYAGDGDPLPAFLDRPYLIPLIKETLEGIAQNFWDTLNAGNRVALAAKQVDLSTGDSKVHIINRFG